MRLGIGSYTFTWAVGVPGYTAPKAPVTAAGLVEKAQKLSVDVVQVCDNLPLHKMDRAELAELAVVAGSAGITLEVGTRGVEAGHLFEYLEIAKILDAKVLRTMIQNTEGEDWLKRTADQIKSVLPAFIQSGVTIALENYEKVKTCELLEVLQRVDSPFVGVCLDTVNSFGALECPDEVVNRLAPYTVNLHVKDFSIDRIPSKMGFSISGAPAGEGLLDVNRLLAVLEKKERNPNVILELWTPFAGTVEDTIKMEEIWAERSIDFLRRRVK